jgi:phosphonate transport system ATP-binding protein
VNVTKRFGRNSPAVHGISLEIPKGEHVAFIGPSGAGKTTLFRMLNCTMRPTSGRLWIDGSETSSLHGGKLREARRKIGTVPQQHHLIPRLKVIHNVLSGRLGQWSMLRSLASLIRPLEVETAYQALDQVGIADKMLSRTDQLSGGQQQRVAIARVLVQDPEVILADEPVSSVDPSLASSILRLLVDISTKTQKTLIVSLHSVDLAIAYFPRIIGIQEGKVLFNLPSWEVSNDLLETLYAGHLPDNHQERSRGELFAPIFAS